MMLSIKIAKLNTTVDFDVESLPKESLQYAIAYGLTQAMNDAHAGVARKNFETDAAYLEAVETKVGKRHDQILTGNVPGSRAPADPNAVKARQLAKACVTAGVDIGAIDPEKLVKWLSRQTEAGRAA